jgi:ParB family chromosome partitioning protein
MVMTPMSTSPSPSPVEQPLVVRALPVDRVRPDPTQPRRLFDVDEIQSLAASIREIGQIQPITVRPDPDAAGSWIIIAGERRWRAHKHNQAATISAIVDDRLEGANILIAQIVENAQRQDMTPLEEADAYQRVVEQLGDVELAAKRLGKSTFRVTERTSLLNLLPEYRGLLASGNLRRNDAFEMSKLSPASQHKLFAAIKAGHCESYKAMKAIARTLGEQEQQTSILDSLVDSLPTPPTADELKAVRKLERKIDVACQVLAGGFDDGEMVAVKRVDPNKAALYADKLAAMQKHLFEMERALRTFAVTGDLFSDK